MSWRWYHWGGSGSSLKWSQKQLYSQTSSIQRSPNRLFPWNLWCLGKTISWKPMRGRGQSTVSWWKSARARSGVQGAQQLTWDAEGLLANQVSHGSSKGACVLKEERHGFCSSTWSQTKTWLPPAVTPGWRCLIVGRPKTSKHPRLHHWWWVQVYYTWCM